MDWTPYNAAQRAHRLPAVLRLGLRITRESSISAKMVALARIEFAKSRPNREERGGGSNAWLLIAKFGISDAIRSISSNKVQKRELRDREHSDDASQAKDNPRALQAVQNSRQPEEGAEPTTECCHRPQAYSGVPERPFRGEVCLNIPLPVVRECVYAV